MIEQGATKAIDSLFDKGVLGTLCVLLILTVIVLGLVIRALYRDLKACNERALNDRTSMIDALRAASDGAEHSEAAFRALHAMLETRGQALADVSHQVDIVAQKVQHGFGNISQALESFVRLIDRGGRDRERERV